MLNIVLYEPEIPANTGNIGRTCVATGTRLHLIEPGAKIYMATTKGPNVYTEAHFEPDCYIMFGKESAGIPEEILHENKENSIRIPMNPSIRSLNLSNSVAIVLYEALRQQNFANMQMTGTLTKYDWD